MATIQNVNLANTFGEWINVTNATVNEVNSLTACNYTKSTGTLYLNDSTLGLSVLANSYFTGNMEISALGTMIVRKNIEVQNTIFLTNKTTGSKSNNIVLEANGVANIAYVNITGLGTSANVANNMVIGKNLSGNTAAFTGVVTTPTAAVSTSNTMVATTAFVQSANSFMKTYVDGTFASIAGVNSINNTYLPLKANIASPTFTGAPIAPTAATGTSNTMIATTAYVQTANSFMKTYVDGVDALKAPLASPTLTGAPLAPTATDGTSNTMIATTAYVQTANTGLKSYADLKFAPKASATLTTPTLTYTTLSAGTATAGQSPLKFTSGTSLSAVEAGATEYDGSNLYFSPEATTTGRGVIPTTQQFVLSSPITAFGPSVGVFFGSTSAIQLLASTTYKIEAYCLFLKTTAGTSTWSPAFSSAPVVCQASMEISPIVGFNALAVGTPLYFAAGALNVPNITFAATGSLTTGVYHVAKFNIFVTTNGATNLRFNVTQSAGTLTPQAGSWYTVRRITSNAGTFAA